MSRLAVRPATTADTDFVLGLVEAFVEFGLPPGCDEAQHAAAFADDLRAALGSQAAIFIAEDEEREPFGFVHLPIVNDLVGRPRAHVSDLAVSATARGRGIGAELLRFADAWARDRGARHIGLTAFASNDRALAVYRRLGYRPTLVTLNKPVSTRSGFYGSRLRVAPRWRDRFGPRGLTSCPPLMLSAHRAPHLRAAGSRSRCWPPRSSW